MHAPDSAFRSTTVPGHGPQSKIRWGEILLFALIATLVSAPFRLNLLDMQAVWPLPDNLAPLWWVLRGVGPAVAYLAVRHLLRSPVPRTVTLLGPRPWHSVLAALPIPLGLAVIGVPGTEVDGGHLRAALIGLVMVLYVLGEEYGWRGYLQQALQPLAPARRVLVIATIWYLWHLNFLRPDVPWTAHLLHFAGLLAGAWGLLRIAERTGSVLFCAGVHLAFNLSFDLAFFGTARWLVLAVAVLVWVVLLRQARAQGTPVGLAD